jgi:SAM-dependent methyltransferase
MEKKTRLNLGCGRDVREGFLNVDYKKFPGVDMVYDLNKVPYPFRDNAFEMIVLRNIIEHLDDPKVILEELHRISKPNARIFIKAPHFSSNNAWADIEHKRPFSSQTFLNQNLSRLFRVVSQRITFSHFRFFMRPVARLNPLFYEKHLAFIFPAVDIEAELEVLK